MSALLLDRDGTITLLDAASYLVSGNQLLEPDGDWQRVESLGTTISATASAPLGPLNVNGGVLTSDQFTGGDTANIHLRNTDVGLGGSALAWTTAAGGGNTPIAIVSGQAGRASGSGLIAYTLTTELDVTVEATVAAIPSSGSFGLFSRWQNNNNYYELRVSSTGVLTIRKTVAGTGTTIATSATAVVAGQRVAMRAFGTSLAILQNGVETATVTDSDLSAGTRVGVIANAGSSIGFVFDDFVTRRSAVPATVDHPAVLDAPLGALVAASSATRETAAVLAAPLGDLTATTTATVEHPAVLAATLGEAAASASATVDLPASLAGALGDLAATATATVEHPATVDAPLGGVVAAATATVDRPAALTGDLGTLVATATATVDHPAVLAAPLGDLTASLTATPSSPSSSVDATLTAPLGGLAGAATGTVEHPVTATSNLGGLTATAAADVAHDATADAPFGELTAAASATVTRAATGTAPLGGMTGAVAAIVARAVVMSAPLGSLTAAIVETVPDLNPVDVTIRDHGHTATIRDTGHTATLREARHYATVR